VLLNTILPRVLRLMSQVHVAWVFATSLCVGVLLIYWLKPQLMLTDMSADRKTIAMFVPYFCVGSVLLWMILSEQLSAIHGILLWVLYLILTLLLYDVFFEPIWHFYRDDPGRYSTYAHAMVSEKTLWGSDAVGKIGVEQAYYVDQPGYRYYLAVMIVLLGGEHRLLHLVNMGVYLAVLIWYMVTIRNYTKTVYMPIGLILVLTLPYAANNVLEGLCEWLTVTLALLYITMSVRGRLILPIIILALIPFIRQNYLLVSIALLILSCIYANEWRTRAFMLLLFILVVLLPLYHNLYYASEFRFLTTNRGSLIKWDDSFVRIIDQLSYVLWWKAKTYLGYWSAADRLRTFEAVLFAPFGTFLVLYYLCKQLSFSRFYFALISALTIGPTIIFGWGYFPRFVFSNLLITLSILPLLMQYKLRHSINNQLESRVS